MLQKIKDNLNITLFEITLMGMLLSIALTSKYFDKFIPHVHPFHIVTLLIGIAILRVIASLLFVSSYVLASSVMFGVEGPTMLASVVHTAESFSLLLFCLFKFFNEKEYYIKLVMMTILIIISMLLYLFLMIVGDSEYTRVSDSTIPFWERVRLALIYPGDWMNITVSTAIAIGIVPISYFTLKPLVNRMKKNTW